MLTHLGDLPVATFLRRDWQRRPRLIRQALPMAAPPVDRAALFALAARDDVDARLVEQAGDRWRLRSGPLGRLPPRSRPGWTVLVQAVDLHDARAAALLQRFRFLPDARLDDLMISYATDGGGVGPHVDSYDVFLLQVHGRRRWRVGRVRDDRLRPGLPLRILAAFEPEQEWVVEPGDLLYLPAGIGHDGIAVGECMTCSVGFRAPRWSELVAPWHATWAEHDAPPGGYADRGTTPTRRPARLPAAMVAQTYAALARRRPARDDAVRTLLTALSEPRSEVHFSGADDDAAPLAPTAFRRAASRRGLVVDRRTRLLYDGGWIGINGEVVAAPPPGPGRRLVQAFADRRRIDAKALAPLLSDEGGSDALLELLHDWYAARWIALAEAVAASP